MSDIAGPCEICGAINYLPSLGGPTICPSCDCGDFGPSRVQKLAALLAAKDARIAELAYTVLKVIGATRAHLPPDGISAKECISRILEATDNPEIIKVLSLPVTPAPTLT